MSAEIQPVRDVAQGVAVEVRRVAAAVLVDFEVAFDLFPPGEVGLARVGNGYDAVEKGCACWNRDRGLGRRCGEEEGPGA